MTRLRHHLRQSIRHLWQTDAPLTATGLLMFGLLGVTVAGLYVDPRFISGAPAWLKPAKFALSIAIYTLTLAWVFGFLGSWRRVRRVVSLTTASVLIMEFAIITVQASRGISSHFNVGTPLDAAFFGLMGAGIVAQTLISMAVAVAGAHTVGAPDGGLGLPGTGWSRGHGDIRVPHFVGLHALQILPLVALALHRRRYGDAARVRLMQVTGAGYNALFVLLLWQALRGQSVIAPDAITIAALVTVSAATATALWRAHERIGTTRRGANAL